MKKLDYDYCHAAPVLEWMSQKWALVAMMRIRNHRDRYRWFATYKRIKPSMLISQFSTPRTSPLGLTANRGCLPWQVFCKVWNDKYGRGFLWEKNRNRYLDIPPASWFFLAITGGRYSDLSGTCCFSIFLDSRNCRALRAFSVWNKYWSTNL